MEDTLQALSEYIATTVLKQPGRDIPGHTALLSTGLVDSFQLVDLALFVEERFGVRIEDTELSTDTFDTLDQLAALVQQRRSNG